MEFCHQVEAEVNHSDILMRNRQLAARMKEQQAANRQSNLAGMGALAGSHVMLHHQESQLVEAEKKAQKQTKRYQYIPSIIA